MQSSPQGRRVNLVIDSESTERSDFLSLDWQADSALSSGVRSQWWPCRQTLSLEGQVAALSLCPGKQPARSGVTNTADEAT